MKKDRTKSSRRLNEHEQDVKHKHGVGSRVAPHEH